MISIAAGFIKGLQLKSPSGEQTRPSSERLRQGVFNVLWNYQRDGVPIIEGAVVSDVFAGSGAWGIEAISHGASSICFLEKHPSTLSTLKANVVKARQALANQNLKPGFSLVPLDLEEGYGKLPESDILFLDPPYNKGFFQESLKQEVKFQKVKEGGLFLFEAQEKESILDSENDLLLKKAKLVLWNEKQYGEARVYFFVKGK